MKKYILLSILLALPQTSRPGFILPATATLLTAAAAAIADYKCHDECGRAYGKDQIEHSKINYRQSIRSQTSQWLITGTYHQIENTTDYRYLKIKRLPAEQEWSEPQQTWIAVDHSIQEKGIDAIENWANRKIRFFNGCCTTEYYLPIASATTLGLSLLSEVCFAKKMVKYKNYGYKITCCLALASIASSALKCNMYLDAQKIIQTDTTLPSLDFNYDADKEERFL